MKKSHVNLAQSKIKDLAKPQVIRWLIRVVVDWLIIGSTIYLAYHYHTWPAAVFAILVIGNRQHALAVMGHEGAHFAICKAKALNDFLGNAFCMWWLGLTVEGYRTLHFQHHKALGTSGDPEVAHKAARAHQWELPLKPLKFASIIFKDFFGGSAKDLWIVLSFSIPRQRSLLVMPALLHAAVLTASAVFHDWYAVAIWYGSLATSFMMFFRIRLWLEHQGTDDTHRLYLNWWQSALFAPHNIWFHWEHHRYPSIPLYNLSKMRACSAGPDIVSLRELVESLMQPQQLLEKR